MAQDLWHHDSASDLVPPGVALDPQAAGPARGDAGLGEAGRARYPLAVLSAAGCRSLAGLVDRVLVAAQHPDLPVRGDSLAAYSDASRSGDRPEEGDRRRF